jgi:hypothetical protein
VLTIRIMEAASYVARHFDLDVDVEVTPAALLRQDSEMALLAAALDRAIDDRGMQVRIDVDDSPQGKRAAIVHGCRRRSISA